MSTGYLYEPLPDVDSGLRLHLNENTDGCSPAVLAAVARVTRQQLAAYPSYSSATEAVARHLGVGADQVLLTNGLDEGILTIALALVPRGDPGRVVVVEPAYGMYGPSARLAGADVVSADANPDLSFSRAAYEAALSADTRLVMLSNPNNPAGYVIPDGTLVDLALELGPDRFLFVDEAYADFAGNSVIASLDRCPNLLVGRTFAKAYGLAGMRIGCVLASPEVIRRLRGAIAPFSVNVFAVAALEAALADRAHLDWYLAQVREARAYLCAAFDRLGLSYWPSAANFVLVRVGDAPRIRAALAGRGVHVRDRSSAPGCAGSIRITVGRVEDARACVAALEEVL